MLLYISLLLIFFSLILVFHNWDINKNANFLAITFFLFAVYGLTHYYTVYGKSIVWMALFYNNISPFMLLPGPFLYFYIRGTLNDKQGLGWKDSIHFVPSIIHFIGVLPYYFTSFSYKESCCKLIIENIDNIKKIEWNIFFDYKFNFFLRMFLLIFYIVYSILLLWNFSKNRKKHKNIPQKQYSVTIRWLSSLLGILFFLVLNYFAMVVNFIFFDPTKSKNNLIFINSAALIIFGFLVINLLLFPEVLYGLPKHKAQKNKIKHNSTTEVEVEKKPMNYNEIDPFLELFEKMKIYLENEKPFFNPNFSISQMSIDLGVPQNHISYCINSLFNTKFSKLRTNLRIEQTKILLNDSTNSKITIEGIAQTVGFTSRSSFYNAFKQETGITPSEYLKNIEMEDALEAENRSN